MYVYNSISLTVFTTGYESVYFEKNGFLALQPIFYIAGMSKLIRTDKFTITYQM